MGFKPAWPHFNSDGKISSPMCYYNLFWENSVTFPASLIKFKRIETISILSTHSCNSEMWYHLELNKFQEVKQVARLNNKN